MQENIEIEALDHFGRGICHIDNKIVFVKNALPSEIVNIRIIKSKKNYSEAEVIKYIRKSSDRIESICPYFLDCGGCQLLFYPYEKTTQFKKNKVRELLNKNHIHYLKDISIIENSHPTYYRNKVSLKIVDGNIGYYKESTHELVEISECKIANSAINQVIANYTMLHLKNGNLTIRTNQNDEVLLVIESEEENIQIDAELKNKVKLVGIVYNGKTIYGDNFLMIRVGGYLFKVSYDSFFQVNPYICKELFSLIEANIEGDSVLDLYSGVGTLSIVANRHAKNVIGVEIIQNAVFNAIYNASLNHQEHIEFLLGNVEKTISKINVNIDTLIVDPPRSGLDKHTISFIKEKKPNKILYVSCDANTLMRDLKLLEDDYEMMSYTILDMFSYSYHLESFVVLKLK